MFAFSWQSLLFNLAILFVMGAAVGAALNAAVWLWFRRLWRPIHLFGAAGLGGAGAVGGVFALAALDIHDLRMNGVLVSVFGTEMSSFVLAILTGGAVALTGSLLMLAAARSRAGARA